MRKRRTTVIVSPRIPARPCQRSWCAFNWLVNGSGGGCENPRTRLGSRRSIDLLWCSLSWHTLYSVEVLLDEGPQADQHVTMMDLDLRRPDPVFDLLQERARLVLGHGPATVPHKIPPS